MSQENKQEESPEKPTSSFKLEENQKIQIHVDGSDFEGFTLRIAGVVAIALGVIWLTDLNEALVFLVATVCWLAYFFYRMARFKEEAYQQIIDDLEAKNDKLAKSNKLLQNAIKDSMGMRVSTKDKNTD